MNQPDSSNPSNSAWGDERTQYFFKLTPERILDAVESAGLRCTGRCLALNSMENRVYEAEIELDENVPIKNPSERFRVIKFYRPGRWSREQILEEHQFLLDLVERDIPVVPPLVFSDGDTLHRMPEIDIWFAVFPKIGGRSPDELDDEQIQQVGRLLGRIHGTGSIRKAPHRIQLTPNTYGRDNLKYLLDNEKIPQLFRSRYEGVVTKICDHTEKWFESAQYQRIHGDCHFGNLLFGKEGFFWVDFDDMVQGPPVQDIWLLLPGRDEAAQEKLNLLLSAYESMRDFDRQSLRLIEPLRALRFVHFSAWMAKRWEDPAFPRAFPYFGSEKYWGDQVRDLEEQLALICNI